VRRESSDRSNVTFKIDKYREGHSTTVRLMGRMRADHISELEKQIRESESKIVVHVYET
jgi:hypothetical protein